MSARGQRGRCPTRQGQGLMRQGPPRLDRSQGISDLRYLAELLVWSQQDGQTPDTRSTDVGADSIHAQWIAACEPSLILELIRRLDRADEAVCLAHDAHDLGPEDRTSGDCAAEAYLAASGLGWKRASDDPVGHARADDLITGPSPTRLEP